MLSSKCYALCIWRTKAQILQGGVLQSSSNTYCKCLRLVRGERSASSSGPWMRSLLTDLYSKMVVRGKYDPENVVIQSESTIFAKMKARFPFFSSPRPFRQWQAAWAGWRLAGRRAGLACVCGCVAASLDVHHVVRISAAEPLRSNTCGFLNRKIRPKNRLEEHPERWSNQIHSGLFKMFNKLILCELQIVNTYIFRGEFIIC